MSSPSFSEPACIKSRTIRELFRLRGLSNTPEYLDPRLSSLAQPDAMADRAVAIERLIFALKNRERIVVFGDYDVDGITSAAILASFLRAHDGDVATLLASRFDGGYGFSANALAKVLAARPRVLVTCDCGSADHPRIADAKAAGIDVIVIDHHLVPNEPLPAIAFLNPHRPDCPYPEKHLASCGLALTLVAGIRTLLQSKFDVRTLLDLVALGTIADVAPLVGDNRTLTRAGLRQIGAWARPGLLALAQVSQMRAHLPVTAEDIGFRLAPRINAPGRLRAPDVSLELLLAHDPSVAQSLAKQMDATTAERRQVESKILAAAFDQIVATSQQSAAAIVVGGDGWNPGVVGIVAARIVDRFKVPAVVIGFDGEIGRGSARGPQGARLHDALTFSALTLIGFGGHQAAAGVTVDAKRLVEFRATFAAGVATIHSDAERSTWRESAVASEVAMDPLDRPSELLADLLQMEPLGMGNPVPQILFPHAKIIKQRVVGNHNLRLNLDYEGHKIEAFGFDLSLPPTSRISIVGSLRYGWSGSPEIRIQGVSKS